MQRTVTIRVGKLKIHCFRVVSYLSWRQTQTSWRLPPDLPAPPGSLSLLFTISFPVSGVFFFIQNVPSYLPVYRKSYFTDHLLWFQACDNHCCGVVIIVIAHVHWASTMQWVCPKHMFYCIYSTQHYALYINYLLDNNPPNNWDHYHFIYEKTHETQRGVVPCPPVQKQDVTLGFTLLTTRLACRALGSLSDIARAHIYPWPVKLCSPGLRPALLNSVLRTLGALA